jgi:outer membrane protein assembly factor BamB
VPVTWSDQENVRWKTALPGAGSSSPIVLGNRVYVTCFSGVDEASGDVSQLVRHLVCLDRQQGTIVWEARVPAEQPEDPYRGMISEHGYASQTPVTDGERIYVFFGKSGVLAFDLQGQQLWQASVGRESGRMRWGSGTSPILYGDYVIVNAADESQSIRAIAKRTGEEAWKAEAAGLENIYATPAIVPAEDGSDDIVVPADGEIWGLNPLTGKLRWYAATGSQGGAYPTVISRDGLLYVFGGRGTGGTAWRAGGQGDVTDSHFLWSSRSGSNVPTPLLHDGHLYWVDDQGTARCVNAYTGQTAYERRLEGMADRRTPDESRGRGGYGAGGGPAVYASPVYADGRWYAVTRRRGSFVLTAKPEFELLAQNRFEADDSQFNASPAISDGQLFLRSDRFLYCLATTDAQR